MLFRSASESCTFGIGEVLFRARYRKLSDTSVNVAISRANRTIAGMNRATQFFPLFSV